MQLPLVLAVMALLAGPALAADSKPAIKPDPAKGQQLATTCLACHTADGTRGLAATPSCRPSTPNIWSSS